MYKKICSILLAVCLCVCIMLSVNAEGGEVKLAVSDAWGSVGSEIDVQIVIENSARVSAGSFNIVYDSSCLELVSCVKGDVFGNLSPNINPNYSSEKIRVTWMASTSVGEGELFNITFRIIRHQSSQVYLENVKLGTVYADNLTYTTMFGKIDVKNPAESILNEIAVSSADNACLKKYDDIYKYSIENMNFLSKKLFASNYDSVGKLSNVVIDEKEFAFSIADINSIMKLFSWSGEMMPLRKAVSIALDKVVKGLITDEGNVVSVSVTNPSALTEFVTVCVVQFDASGSIVKSIEEKNTVQSGGTDTFILNFDLEKDVAYVEVFVLNQDMNPMDEVLIFEA